MFSLSRIHGALGDNGQNYKTLSYLAKSLGAQELNIMHGCGNAVAQVPRQLKAEVSQAPPPVWPISSCGEDPNAISDCAKVDLGACGNACCFAELSVDADPPSVYAGLQTLLNSTMDSKFTYVTGGTPNPADDLRPYKITQPLPFQFILQGTHSTLKYFGENADILNVAVAQQGAGSLVRLFSISRIHGALGDRGQNYKSVSYLANSLVGSSNLRVLHGCGGPWGGPLQDVMV